jgi:hypothetical protein
VFDEPPGGYGICPLCNCVDDHVQLIHPAMGGGADEDSLCEHQQILIQRTPLSTKQYGGYNRGETWRPLLSGEMGEQSKQPETGTVYFEAAGEDTPEYNWRRKDAT